MLSNTHPLTVASQLKVYTTIYMRYLPERIESSRQNRQGRTPELNSLWMNYMFDESLPLYFVRSLINQDRGRARNE